MVKCKGNETWFKLAGDLSYARLSSWGSTVWIVLLEHFQWRAMQPKPKLALLLAYKGHRECSESQTNKIQGKYIYW